MTRAGKSVRCARGERQALAIVAKYPRPGAVKTRLAAALGAEGAAALYRAFLLDLAERFGVAAAREGYALVWAHTPDPGDLRAVVGARGELLAQRGSDFGERLYHVAADLAARGYGRIVIVSSDAPLLPARAVRGAFAALAHPDTEAVLAPADDGGYSLVGLRARPTVPDRMVPDLFRGIRMSTPRVFAETVARAAALGITVARLPEIRDVDELSDVRRLAVALARPAGEEAPHTRAALAGLGLMGRRAVS